MGVRIPAPKLPVLGLQVSKPSKSARHEILPIGPPSSNNTRYLGKLGLESE